MMLVAFDVLTRDKQELQRLFKLLTQRIAFLTRGGMAAVTNPQLPPLDSGILGAEIAPDNLTMTVSVGHSLFDSRFGLAALKPAKLQAMSVSLTTLWMQISATAICCCKSVLTRRTR